MKIEVAKDASHAQKARGDLLEELCSRLLAARNFEVVKELGNTGTEIDLLCTSKSNKNRNIYVECKAYREPNKVGADTLHKMMGIRMQKNYQQAWLISTAGYTKGAEGIIKEEEDKGSVECTYYTPIKLITALIDCNEIENSEISKKLITNIVGENKIGSCLLLITGYGYFWVHEYIVGGSVDGVFVAFAKNSEVVKDVELLEKLANTDTSYNKYDFKKIFFSETSTIDKYGRLIFKEEHYNRILDTGVKLTHPRKEKINIEDLFVFQDIQKVNDNTRLSSSSLTSLTDKPHKVIIFGDDMSGKTTLAYKLQRSYVEQNYYPVYINSNRINSSLEDKFENLIYRMIKKQYKNIDDDFLESIDHKKIIVIIDDYQNIKINRDKQIILNGILTKKYSGVIIFSNISKRLEVVTNNELHESFLDFDLYNLNQYGYKLRDEVIAKWLSIGQDQTLDNDTKHQQVIEISKTINTTVGNGFVPTYPIFILTLLQSFEATTSTNVFTGSAYAEFYNYLITHALGSSGIEPSEFGLYYSYLSELSFKLFHEVKNDVDRNELEIFHKQFIEKKKLNRDFNRFTSALIISKILKLESDGESYRFNHNYIYYFFVGKYLSEKITNKRIQEIIQSITKRVYLTEFSNILLFLVHFSKDQFIFDGILGEAKSVFKDLESVTFNKAEFVKINKLINEEVKILIEDNPVEKNRQQELQRKDDISIHQSSNCNSKEIHSYKEDIHELDIFSKVNLSFKLVGMLGQLAKNYNELDGDVKVEIVEEAYDLGLRSLKQMLDSFEEYSEIIKEEISSKIEAKNINSEAEKMNLSSKITFQFATMISLGFLAKISSSVASKDLRNITEEVYNSDPTIAKSLINIAIDLDFSNGLNINKIVSLHEKIKDNNLCLMLLRLFVTRHLYKFNVEHSKRQRICTKLNIGIEQQRSMITAQSKQIK